MHSLCARLLLLWLLGLPAGCVLGGCILLLREQAREIVITMMLGKPAPWWGGGGGMKKDGEGMERIKVEKDERFVKEMVDPRRPTQKEVGDHGRTHLPYRNWCAICVKAKGRDADHRRGGGARPQRVQFQLLLPWR